MYAHGDYLPSPMSHFNSSISPHSARAWHSLCPRPSHVIWTRALAGRERSNLGGKSPGDGSGARTKAAFMTAGGLIRSTPDTQVEMGPRAERVISVMISAPLCRTFVHASDEQGWCLRHVETRQRRRRSRGCFSPAVQRPPMGPARCHYCLPRAAWARGLSCVTWPCVRRRKKRQKKHRLVSQT